ncbi:MAG: TonB-dependent receptor [Gammaproteobacteria bacterium]|nr:TonB-dependent receptor [Gammaproteobacteria bacterium]
MRVFLAAFLAAAPLTVGASSADLIETLVVRAARTPIPAPSVGSSVSVLTQSDLAARQVISIADVLRSIPGVAVSRSGGVGAQTQLRIRGGEANHVLVLIDGVVVNDPAQGDEFNFAHLLNYQLGGIEVTRGPQSALWGSAAVSGVVNVVSAKPSDGQAFDLFVEGGSDSYQHIGGSAAHAGERLTARVSVNSVDTDGQNIARSGSEDDGYENTTTSLGLGYAISPTFRVDGNFRYTDATTQFDGIDFSTGLPVDRANETESEQLYGRISASLDTLDGRWTHQLSINFTDTDNLNTTENAFAATGFDISRAAAEAYHYTYQTSFVPLAGHTLTGAFERQEQDFKQRGAVVFGDPNRDESLDWNSWVGEYRGDLTENVSLLASIRHDQNSDFDDATTGRISGAWRVNGGTTKLRAAYGTGVKNPTFTERFGFFTNFIGNPNLKPEESRGWEVGIDQQLFDGQLALQLTWFDETLEDEINGFVFEPISGAFTADNETGESERQGVEIGAQWQITNGLRLGFAYTYLDATEEDSTGSQTDEIRRANHIANVNLDWQSNARLSVNLNVDYNGEQDDFFFPPTPPFQETVTLDSFTLVNLAARYQVSPAISLFARIENAFDEDYEEIFGFSAPGRTAFAGIRYQPGAK